MVLKTAERIPLVTEESLLNEANECVIDRPLDVKPLSEERAFAFWQKDIPETYWSLGGDALASRIAAARRKLDRKGCDQSEHQQAR